MAVKTLLSIAALLVPVLAAPALAQDQDGPLLTFGVSFRAQTNSNAGLDPVSPGASNTASVGLSFGVLSETNISRLAFDASAKLLAANGAAAPVTGFVDPRLSLSYMREAANADFSFDASLSGSDLGSDLDVTDFDAGPGTRIATGLSTALNWGKTAPLGFGISAGLTTTTYQDAAPDLIDNRTLRAGASIRADLSDVVRLNLGLNASQFEKTGLASRDTLGLDAGLTLIRPRGEISLRAAITDTADGTRQSLNFGHTMTLPDAALSYSLGASRGVDAQLRLTGSLDYQRDLPNGAFTIGLTRSLAAGSDTDAENLASSASVGYQTALGPLSNLSLSLNWAESIDTATTLGTANTSLQATYSQSLAKDWALDVGYTHRLRDKDGVGRGVSDTLFLDLRRDFSLRF